MALAEQKKDLVKKFSELVDEFRKESANGSIEIHFSQGSMAKLHFKKVF